MHSERRRFLQTVVGMAGAGLLPAEESRAEAGTNLARAACRDLWLHHPVLGDPSWDTFRREPGNPIHKGEAPYFWPVNGFLFHDPPSRRWYAYASVYPRGYWPPPPVNSRLLRERPGGGWETLDLLFPSGTFTFANGVQAHAMTDVSVVYAAGRYHLLYGWTNAKNERGGLGYAQAAKPEGPWNLAPLPIHDDAVNPPILNRYVRAYASTLLQRKNDWLILHMMSTPRNAGGTWALFAMTASRPEGPYSAPVPLLFPQSDRFHPPLAEYFPAFVHGEDVIAPASSVALNRTFQSVWRAKLEQAHTPEAWEPTQYGSVWHAEGGAWEAQGIWGQTFSGQVDSSGNLRVLFPSKSADDIGAIHLARRPWNRPYRDGFVLSAPRGPSLAILRQEYEAFTLTLRVRASGAWALGIGCRSPLGPDQPYADCTLHPQVRTRRVEWRRNAAGWTLVVLDSAGDATEIASGNLPLHPDAEETVLVTRASGNLRLRVNGKEIWQGAFTAAPGRLELLAETGTRLSVSQFTVQGKAGRVWEDWLAAEALSGSAAAPDEWQAVRDTKFRFGTGYLSRKSGTRAKWNYFGSDFRLYAPLSPDYGRGRVLVDGREVAVLDFHASRSRMSTVVLAQTLPPGRHAVVLEATEGVVPCDTLQILPF